ncbi:MAG: hypothetical protein ACRDK9_10175 [Solirubrobacterales bacterium]
MSLEDVQLINEALSGARSAEGTVDLIGLTRDPPESFADALDPGAEIRGGRIVAIDLDQDDARRAAGVTSNREE